MLFAESRRISQALLTAHITDTSRRSPSGVMLRARRVGSDMPIGQSLGAEGEMFRTTLGTTLLAGVFLVAGLAGVGASWAAWPRTSTTSPLMALFALTWGCAYVITGVLTWRRSRFAAPAFVAAIGLLLFPARFIVPGGQLLVPSFVALTLIAFLGHRYLRRTT